MAGIILFKRIDADSRVVMLMLVGSSIAQMAAFFLKDNHVVWKFFNLYAVTDAIGWAYIFIKHNRKPATRSIIVSIVSAQVISAVYLFLKKGLGARFYNEYVCLNSLLETVWVMIFFYEHYSSESLGPLEKQSMFWFCLGILIYSPTTYFLFVFYDRVKFPAFPEYAHLWKIHDLLNALMYFTFMIGIIIGTKNNIKPGYDIGEHQS